MELTEQLGLMLQLLVDTVKWPGIEAGSIEKQVQDSGWSVSHLLVVLENSHLHGLQNTTS